MATDTALPRPMRMNIAHGGRAAILMVATGAAADHSLTTAVIVGSFGLAGVIIGPFVTDAVRARRRRVEVDHREEQLTEYREINEHLIGQLDAAGSELEELRRENARLRRRR